MYVNFRLLIEFLYTRNVLNSRSSENKKLRTTIAAIRLLKNSSSSRALDKVSWKQKQTCNYCVDKQECCNCKFSCTYKAFWQPMMAQANPMMAQANLRSSIEPFKLDRDLKEIPWETNGHQLIIKDSSYEGSALSENQRVRGDDSWQYFGKPAREWKLLSQTVNVATTSGDYKNKSSYRKFAKEFKQKYPATKFSYWEIGWFGEQTVEKTLHPLHFS